MTPNRGNQYFPFPLLEEKPQQQSNNSMYRFQTFQQASSFTRPVSSQASLQPEYNQKSSDDYAEQLSYYVDGSPQLEQTKSISEDANHGSGKWVSSKMRFMRKLRNIRSNAQQQAQGDSRTNGNSRCSNINFNDTIVIRVCSDCNTTKTPLWRGGPQGPKSLCNACGIRQRKARKAMAAEALDITTTNKDKQITSKICNDHQLCSESPHKKRCSSTSSTSTSKFFSSESNDDLSINLNRSSDVKEAARLLMALSSDIICG